MIFFEGFNGSLFYLTKL